ncbi:beta-ketoacyl synthase chain length factor [Bdellovibrio sp. SKB1291214]|uniref:beta-ketoacyl synthase chain length factor n=1 Tax=Bdellovibrio sp. SKB1291214 TaxID=1732569 RepID=UPI000B51B6F8|nr:beta-ketoacyl synthase chain length factor [Bdellovibrio sp. SKB1291214]UYL09607.1 beta-ketoacyl synthase chain length factor [Bdellovibrio sp. SKB1291214]
MKLIAESSLRTRDISMDSLDPSYRRATLNMALTTLTAEKVLQQLPAGISKDQVSFVVATHFGEVSSTLEFLNTYYETQTPRPILFQNSLHNSTLGFASIQLGMTGPGMTISCDSETVKSAHEAGRHLLTLTPYVLISIVDCVPEELTGHYLEKFPFLGEHLNQATSYLFART